MQTGIQSACLPLDSRLRGSDAGHHNCRFGDDVVNFGRLHFLQNRELKSHYGCSVGSMPCEGYSLVELLWLIVAVAALSFILVFYGHYGFAKVFSGVVAGSIVALLLLGFLIRIVRYLFRGKE